MTERNVFELQFLLPLPSLYRKLRLSEGRKRQLRVANDMNATEIPSISSVEAVLAEDVTKLATFYLIYKIGKAEKETLDQQKTRGSTKKPSPHIYIFAGDAINKYYFPTLLLVGTIGNILAFLVSIFSLKNIQKMSFQSGF